MNYLRPHPGSLLITPSVKVAISHLVCQYKTILDTLKLIHNTGLNKYVNKVVCFYSVYFQQLSAVLESVYKSRDLFNLKTIECVWPRDFHV